MGKARCTSNTLVCIVTHCDDSMVQLTVPATQTQRTSIDKVANLLTLANLLTVHLYTKIGNACLYNIPDDIIS